VGAEALIDHYARAFVDSAALRGLSVEELGVTPHPEGTLFDAQDLATISRNAKLLLEDELCGLTANPLRPGPFALMCEIATSSPTLRIALDRAFRLYGAATEDVRFQLSIPANHAAIHITSSDPRLDPRRVLTEWWALFWHRFAQWLIGSEIPVAMVELDHEPMVATSNYSNVFRVECLFGAPHTQLQFDAAHLDREVTRSPDDVPDFVAPRPSDLVTMEGVKAGIVSVLKTRLRSYLQTYQTMPKLEMLAREQGVCSQTLRRRLDAEGTSYRALKSEVRREIAMKYIANHAMPISQASLQVGFAEPNGLSRAFKAWAGVSASDYREMIAARYLSSTSCRAPTPDAHAR